MSRFVSATMSNCCCTSVTSLAGSSPLWRSAASNSNSLPKPQLPTRLPSRSATDSMPSSAQLTCSVPERWKTWPMLVISAPCSRVASALGTQAMAKSALPSATLVWGTMSTPPSTISTSSPTSSK